ncbi:hypothetical protein L226DRAFT_353625 [Lentinus tigrinus ALCF2SS1-7]|uniref:uncharacterized protein n=1 Tax=Lentinus tigrinus ALCF2SS1-7 TaxID=1328758 RepID=UPI001165E540|nr:hypothetical protein L226DRAFT_353625 [Lentinus tigrinus ALCF2SS1-7]
MWSRVKLACGTLPTAVDDLLTAAEGGGQYKVSYADRQTVSFLRRRREALNRPMTTPTWTKGTIMVLSPCSWSQTVSP